MSHDRFAALYDRGMAVGTSNIVNDTMTFTYRDEEFMFPTFNVYQFVEWTGLGFYVCPVDKLREIEREATTV